MQNDEAGLVGSFDTSYHRNRNSASMNEKPSRAVAHETQSPAKTVPMVKKTQIIYQRPGTRLPIRDVISERENGAQ